MEEVNRILESDLPELDKLLRAFVHITGIYLAHGQHELDLQRALEDEEGLVKIQIKLSTIEHCRDILQQCYRLITRRRSPDGQDEL